MVLSGVACRSVHAMCRLLLVVRCALLCAALSLLVGVCCLPFVVVWCCCSVRVDACRLLCVVGCVVCVLLFVLCGCWLMLVVVRRCVLVVV